VACVLEKFRPLSEPKIASIYILLHSQRDWCSWHIKKENEAALLSLKRDNTKQETSFKSDYISNFSSHCLIIAILVNCFTEKVTHPHTHFVFSVGLLINGINFKIE
jgi:hypothetical protein